MKLFYLLLSILLPFSLNAQKLTKGQAMMYAEKLYLEEILSEKGKNLLIKHIQENKFERLGRADLHSGSIPVNQDISLANILIYCSEAFGSEFYYRLGMTEHENMQREIKKKYGDTEPTEKQYEEISRKYEKRFKESEVYWLEERIPAEDSLPEAAKSVIHPFSMPQSKEYRLIHSNRSALGKTCTRTLQDLLDIGLIDEKIYKDVLKEIKEKRIYYEMMVVGFAAQRAVYYEDFAKNKANEITFLTHLKEKGIMSEQAFGQLISSYKDYELKEKFDFIAYCNNALTFDLLTYPLEPARYYEKIFKEIQKIIPNFNYSDLTVTIKDNDEFKSDLIEQKATISFVVEGRKYAHTFFHDFVRKEPAPDEKPDTLPQISNDFHKGINKLLADRSSPQRLYYANKSEWGNAYSNQTFGLILLTEDQFKAWGGYNADYFLFTQSHDNTFNSDNIKRIVEEYEKIGLFTHLTEQEKIEAKEKIAESEIDSYQSILLCFPKTIVYFDWETANLENPYEELTIQFGEASKGTFMPTHIKDGFKKDWEKKTTLYGFEFKGKKYEEELKMDSDWLDPTFMELLDKAIAENKVDSKIYYCFDNGQAAGYIFLTHRQYEYLQAKQPTLFPK